MRESSSTTLFLLFCFLVASALVKTTAWVLQPVIPPRWICHIYCENYGLRLQPVKTTACVIALFVLS